MNFNFWVTITVDHGHLFSVLGVHGVEEHPRPAHLHICGSLGAKHGHQTLHQVGKGLAGVHCSTFSTTGEG